MGRKATPRKWRDWYVTEAGGQGMKKLCPISDGMKKAKTKLAEHLESIEEEKKEAKRAGLVETDTPYKVSHLAAEFLQLKEATKHPETLEFYQKNLVAFVDVYGDLEARKLGLHHATEYISDMKKKGLGNTTINHRIRSVKAVFNYGVDSERVIKNPWKRVQLLPERKRKRTVTDEEFQKLLKACDGCIAYRGMVSAEENAQLLRDVLHVLRYTAMRPGELRKLRWDHLHLDEEFIIIPASEHKTGTTAKNPEDRVIPIMEEVKPIFLSRKEKYGHQPLVFPNIAGKLWAGQGFSQRFSRLRKRAGLDEPDRNGEKLVWYSLRHTRLSEVAKKEGWDPFSVMRLGGHTSIEMTKRYIHVGAEDLKRSAREGRQRRLALEAEESKK